MGGPPLYSQRKGDCSHLWYFPVSDLNLLCIRWLLKKLPPHMDSSFILPIESKVLQTVPLKSQELTKLIRHPSLLSDFVHVSWVLANIMTESSCCSWKCNRNSEHRLCMMGIKLCLKFLVVSYIVVSIPTVSSWCDQWQSVMAAHHCYLWWRWWVRYFVSSPHKVMMAHCHAPFKFLLWRFLCTSYNRRRQRQTQ
jgi:hypothetical protein